MKIEFVIQLRRHKPDPRDLGPVRPTVVLAKDNWNDFSYMTMADAYVFDIDSDTPIELGGVRIMKLGQSQRDPWTFENGPHRFNSLNDEGDYCSLGLNIEYYERLLGISSAFAQTYLNDLCDVTYDSNVWLKFENDSCFNISLLRDTGRALVIEDTAAKLNALAPISLRSLKRVLNAAADTSLKVALEVEGHAYEKLRWTEDYMEGIQAFTERRKATYKGR